MLDLAGKTVSLVGYGVSNRAVGKYLREQGVDFVVRCQSAVDLENGTDAVFGDGYLDTCEDVIFRSPGVHPRLIKGHGAVYTEVGFGLETARCAKIAVSGSDGKTTTSTLIYQMLRQGGKNAFLGGNIGYPIISLAGTLTPTDYLVAEMSSFQLMDTAPSLDIAAVTNVSQNHLDWHANMDEYISAKKNIVKNAALAVLNYDDCVVRSFEARRRIYFSLSDRRDLLDKGDFVHVVDGFVCYNRERLFKVSDICLRGEFNVMNVLCAVGCAYGIVGKDACHKVALEFCGVGGRQEALGTVNGVTYVNSAIDTTPTRTKNTLSAYEGKGVVAILGGYDKNLDYTCLADILSSLKAVILCGENREKISRVSGRRTYTVNTLEEAVEVASEIALKGDFVILTPASASFDMFKDYKEKGMRFAQCVRRLGNG